MESEGVRSETLTQDTKKKCLNPKKLFDIVLDTIVGHIGDYTRKDVHFTKDLFCLSKPMQRQVLHALTRSKCKKKEGDVGEFQKRFKAFNLLLPVDSETTEIDCGGLMSFCPREIIKDAFARVVELISIHCPNIESLYFAVDESPLDEFAEDELNNLTVDMETINSICRMKKLKILEVNCCSISFDHVKFLCHTLRCLEELYVDISFSRLSTQDSNDFKNLDADLRVFFISSRSATEYALLALYNWYSEQIRGLESEVGTN